MKFPEGERLFEEGAPIEGLHCLQSGRVVLSRRQEKQICILAVAPAGDVLGMPDILREETYRSRAMTLQETVVCFIPREEALRLFRTNPAIMVRIMRKVCDRIVSMERYATDDPGADDHYQ